MMDGEEARQTNQNVRRFSYKRPEGRKSAKIREFRRSCFDQTEKSRPLSRVLSWTAIPLGHASPRASSDLPGDLHVSHTLRCFKPPSPYLVLLPVGFAVPVMLPPLRCALTAPFHPYRPLARLRRYLSVALSVDSRPPGVTWHRALWSPDFPPCADAHSGCLADSWAGV
jgi:hypothetical protein